MDTNTKTNQASSLARFQDLAKNMSPTSRLVAVDKGADIKEIGLWQRFKRFFNVSSVTRRAENKGLAETFKTALKEAYNSTAVDDCTKKLLENPTNLSARRITSILTSLAGSEKVSSTEAPPKEDGELQQAIEAQPPTEVPETQSDAVTDAPPKENGELQQAIEPQLQAEVSGTQSDAVTDAPPKKDDELLETKELQLQAEVSETQSDAVTDAQPKKEEV